MYLNILSWNFLYLFKMYEQGGGQVLAIGSQLSVFDKK